MAAAVGPAEGVTHAYAAVPQWLTGMAVASIRPLT
jgi:2,3-dihydroxyphenylpropionate 1,2-dioxygenase